MPHLPLDNLLHFIRTHDQQAAQFGPDHILVHEYGTREGGELFHCVRILPANLSAVRDWLGY